MTYPHQRAYRLQHRASGKCRECPRAIVPGTTRCARHLSAQREHIRAIHGYEPWRPGSRGRKPIGTITEHPESATARPGDPALPLEA